MSFALVLAPPPMPSSAHSSLLHRRRKQQMTHSPSPSRSPSAHPQAQAHTPQPQQPQQQQQPARPGVITLSKPLHAYSHKREQRDNPRERDAASLPPTPGPAGTSADDSAGAKERKAHKGRHARTRSAANTPGGQSGTPTPADRPASPTSQSPSARRPQLPHLPTEPASPTQARRKAPHKRARSAAPSRAGGVHTPAINAGAEGTDDDLFAVAHDKATGTAADAAAPDTAPPPPKAPELLAATAQEQAKAAGPAPISLPVSANDSRTTTPPPGITAAAAPATPTGSAPLPLPIPASAPAGHNHLKKGRQLRNSMINIPAGVHLTPGSGAATPTPTPAKGQKAGSMRIPRPKSQPLSHAASQLSHSVPASQTLGMMMPAPGSSPAVNVTPAREPRNRHPQSENRHKPALSLALPMATMSHLPGAASLPTTPLPHPSGTNVFAPHARGATYPVGSVFPMEAAEESFAYSSSQESDHSAPDIGPSDDLDEQIVFFGQRGSPDLDHARKQKNVVKKKLEGKEVHHKHEKAKREKLDKRDDRVLAKSTTAIAPAMPISMGKKIVYAGPQFYNSPAPDALPPPTF